MPRYTNAAMRDEGRRSATKHVTDARPTLRRSVPHALMPRVYAARNTWEMAAGPMPTTASRYASTVAWSASLPSR